MWIERGLDNGQLVYKCTPFALARGCYFSFAPYSLVGSRYIECK